MSVTGENQGSCLGALQPVGVGERGQSSEDEQPVKRGRGWAAQLRARLKVEEAAAVQGR